MFDPYLVKSNQFAPHPSTESLAEKHANANYRRPYSHSQLGAFKIANDFVSVFKKKIILDSGCGTGDSSFWLSKQFPNCIVVGVDQSEARLAKANAKLIESMNENVFFVRARLEDFWRLALEANWKVERHYIFYPNPWPKSEHLSRRWHGHPVFNNLLKVSPCLELRSNWLIYLEEFSIAAKALTGISSTPTRISDPEGISAFERKYLAKGSECYVLRYANLPERR